MSLAHCGGLHVSELHCPLRCTMLGGGRAVSQSPNFALEGHTLRAIYDVVQAAAAAAGDVAEEEAAQAAQACQQRAGSRVCVR